jgi:hypothetical protein
VIIKIPIELPLGLNNGAKAAVQDLEKLENKAKKATDATREFGRGAQTSSSHAGAFADKVGKVSTTLARSANQFGLAAGPLRALNDVADVAELGFVGLGKGALTAAVGVKGFQMALLGPIAAAAAIGAALGTLLNKFEFVRNGADSVTGALYGMAAAMGLVEKGNPEALKGIGDFSKNMAASNANALRKQAAQLRAGGMSNRDLADFFGVKMKSGQVDPGRLKTRELAEELGLTRDILKADEKRLDTAKKQKEELRQLIEMMSGPKFNPAGALKVDFAKDLMGGGIAKTLALSESRTSVRAKPADLMGSLMGSPIAKTLSLSWTKEWELERIGKIAAKEKAAAAEALRWQRALEGVALMAGAIGGNFGAALQVVGNLSEQFKGWGKMTGEQKAGLVLSGVGQIGGVIGGKGGAALSGAAGGAMAGLSIGGPIGAVAGGVIGGIAGLFGHGKREREEAREMRDSFVESAGGLAALRAKAMEAGVSLDRLFGAKDKKGIEAAIKSITEGLDKFEHKMQSLKEARGAAESIMDRLAGGEFSDKLRESLGTMVGKVQEALLASGLGFMATGPLRESKEFGAAQGMASDAAQLLAAMREAGFVDSGLMGAASQSAEELRQQAVAAAEAAGVAPAEATKAGFGAIAPLLREQLNAAMASGQELDANTQALLAEAKANGINIVADPIVQQLAVQKDMLGELRAMNRGGGEPKADQEFATGSRGLRLVKRDMLARIHEGEGLLVVPRNEMGNGRLVFESFAKGTDTEREPRDRPGPSLPDGGPGGGGGTAGGGGGTTPADVLAIVEAAMARTQRVVQVSSTFAPQVTVVDESLVKTIEGQRAFNRLLGDELHQVLRQGHAGLEADIAQVVRRELRSAS